MKYEDLLKYAGENGEYYAQFLERYTASENFLSWNWTAFFFLPFFLLYRKLWKAFFLLLVLSSFLIVMVYTSLYFYAEGLVDHYTSQSIALLLGVTFFLLGLIAFLLSLQVNALYLQKAEQVMARKNFQEGEGRSVKAVWIYVTVLVASTAFATWGILKLEHEQREQASLFMKQSTVLNSELKVFKEKLSELLYERNWQEAKVLIESKNDLSEFSKVDFMFRIIFQLIDNQQVELLGLLIDKQLNIPIISKSSGRDFIDYSYKKKKWKALKLLMTKGAFPFDKALWMRNDSYHKKRPLQFVIQQKELEVLTWLIKEGVPVKAKFYEGKSPLMLAVEADSLEMIELLVVAGAKISYKNLEGFSAIALSQKSKEQKVLAYFASKVSADTFTIAMLNEAIKKNDLALIKRIVPSGIDMSQKAITGYDKKIPLEVAIYEGNVTILDYLLSYGMEVNQRFGAYEYDAVYESISQHNGLEILRCLLKHGAEVNPQESKHSALDQAFAPRGDWVDRAKLLVEHNASLTKKINRDGQIALHASLEHPDEKLTELIIDKMLKQGYRKELSLQDAQGETPLHDAVAYNKPKIVQKLLDLGVDTKILNKRKVQAISYATTEKLLKLLEPYSDHKPSISDSYCMVYVLGKFEKNKIKHCADTAKYYESTKEHTEAIWYYFLANDLESIKRYSKDMSWIESCNCRGYYAYMDIAHAYLLSNDIESTKKYYLLLAEASRSEMYKKWMVRRFKILEGLHEGYGEKAKQLWDEVWKERYKENFFDVYDVAGMKLGER